MTTEYIKYSCNSAC